MPSKRSKSYERERKARARLRMSDDAKAAESGKDREDIKDGKGQRRN